MRVQDLPGERIGPYRLLRRLGEGGMGVVYLATGTADQLVAVKVLRPAMAEDEHARRRLAREVETTRRVRSRHVAEIVDADLTCDPPYIVTRFVPGLTLDAVVRGCGPLTGTALARLAAGLAEALQEIHAASVVHRDLKPGNVMISDGEPVVIDFGIAQLPDTTRLTMTGMFMGTPGYLAPEVIEGKDSGTAADVHSWGATIAFAATGRPPFGAGSYETVFFRIVHGQPNLDTLPAALGPLVRRSLSRDPGARPAAAELRQRAAVLDPAALVPGPATAGGDLLTGPAVDHDLLARTVTDGPAAERRSTRPMSVPGTDDVRDLLPPVSYAPAGGSVAAGAAAGLAGIAGVPGGLGGGAVAGPAWPAAVAAGGPAWPAADSPWAAGAQDGAGGQRAAGGAALAGRGMPWAGGGQAVANPPDLAADGAPAGFGRLHGAPLPGGQAQPRGAAARRPVKPVSSWSPLVLAVIAMAAAVSVLAPIVGTIGALALLVALRAAGITGRRLAKRRAEDTARGAGPLVAVAFYPLAVLRSLISLVLLAPVGVLGFGIASAITIIAVPVHPLPKAFAFGAGALVTIVGLGPGSGPTRATLARLFGAVARTPSRLIVAYVGVLAIAAWVGLQALGQPAAYWPSILHSRLLHLPTVHSLLFDVRLNLLKLARQFGF